MIPVFLGGSVSFRFSAERTGVARGDARALLDRKWGSGVAARSRAVTPRTAGRKARMLSFRPLLPADFPLLLDWLSRPHIKE